MEGANINSPIYSWREHSFAISRSFKIIKKSLICIQRKFTDEFRRIKIVNRGNTSVWSQYALTLIVIFLLNHEWLSTWMNKRNRENFTGLIMNMFDEKMKLDSFPLLCYVWTLCGYVRIRDSSARKILNAWINYEIDIFPSDLQNSSILSTARWKPSDYMKITLICQ